MTAGTRTFDGEVIAAHRARMEWTTTQLAAAVGVTSTTVAGWETGRHTPSAQAAADLADVFGIDINDLFAVRTKARRRSTKKKADGA